MSQAGVPNLEQVDSPPVEGAADGSGASETGRVDTADLDETLAGADVLVQDIESLLRTESESDVAKPTPVHDAAVSESVAAKTTTDAASNSLNAIDQSLSDDLDNLLQGNFESIDAVLDGVFEEHAVLVQEPGPKPAAPPIRREHPPEPVMKPPPPTPVAEPLVAVPPAEPQEIPEPIAPVDPMAEIIEPVAASQPVAVEPTAQPIEPTAAAIEATPVPVIAQPAPIAAEVDQPAAPTPVPTPVVAAKSAPVLSQPAPTVVDLESQTPAAPARSIKLDLKPLALKLSKLLVTALVCVNYPLRYVPADSRKLVNIVALSLLLWGPLVWVLAPTLASTEPAKPTIAGHGETAAHGGSDGHGESKKSDAGHGAAKKSDAKHGETKKKPTKKSTSKKSGKDSHAPSSGH